MASSIAFAGPVQPRKLRPPRLDRRLIARPRLMTQLDARVQQPLTLVVAPAGFGKTTIVAQWLAGIPTAAAWLTLDAGDDDARRFVTHVLAALESITSLAGGHIGDLVQTPGAVPMADLGAALADDLYDATDDLILVLDDAQAVTSPDVFTFLAQFLALVPPQIHLVLVSRTDPPLALARLRSHGKVTDLRAAELSFTDEEAQTLLAAFSPVGINAPTVARLQAQTEGWVTGLLLAAQALTVLTDPDAVSVGSTERHHVMQFLVEEVLANQSPAIQAFLLRTALTERICAELADALFEDGPPAGSRVMLDHLVHAGLFLEPMSEEAGWYRYHPLFRQLLRHQISQRFTSDVIGGLHIRAARWYAQQELIDHAITHLLAAGDLTACADLVEQHLHRALSKEDWSAVARWIRLLPEDVLHERPALLLARGWVAHLSGRAAPLRMILSEIEPLLAISVPDPDAAEALRSEVAVLAMATLLPIEQDPVAAHRSAEQALTHLSLDHRFSLGLAHAEFGMALQALGQEQQAVSYLEGVAEREAEQIDAGSIRALLGLIFIHRQAANFAACEKVARPTRILAERHDLPVTAGWAHSFLGWLAYERDDLDAATSHFAAVAADDRRVHLSCLREAMFGMALVLQAKGQPLAAESTLQRLIEIIIDAAALEHLPTVYAFEARLALLRHDLAAASHWEATADVSIDSNLLHAFEHALLTKAKVLLAQDSPESLAKAAQALAALQVRATSTHHLARLAEIWAVTALVYEAQGRSEAALEALQRSLALAQRGTFSRTFTDLGPAFGALLHRVHAQLAATPLLERLLAAAAQPSVAEPTAPARPMSVLKLLTLRECDVLEGLGRRHSYQEIADALFISPQTVKRHVGNIYSKFGVANRREALSMAESLGWQPRI